MFKLAKRLVLHPRHRSLHDVDSKSYKLLRRRIEDLVPRETREEVKRLLKSNERFKISVGPKTGNGRREDRTREQSVSNSAPPTSLLQTQANPSIFFSFPSSGTPVYRS